MTTEAADRTALETTELLAYRLRRIEFLLTGSDEEDQQLQKLAAQAQEHSLHARITSLENDLARLASKSAMVDGLLKLYAVQPDLFQTSNPDEVPTTLSTPELLAIISASAASYPVTASRLTSIKDLPVPSTESSTALIALQPRIARLELLQDSQNRELAELRLRSASVIKRWYELGPLGGSECWAEWEGRMTTLEKLVRQQEAFQARELEAKEAYKS